jgi:hypothetical protein
MQKIEKFIHDDMPQEFYDHFNEFIFANESKVFEKLVSKVQLVTYVKDVPGSIVELGVFKGSGLVAWLKVCRTLNLRKRVYGFDFFDANSVVSSITTSDKELMSSLFKTRGTDFAISSEVVNSKIQSAGFANFELISGDVKDTLPIFLQSNPGFRASLVNFDLDTYEPTIFALENLWDRLTKGGIMVFDEYAINEWTESDAVDQFINKHNLELISTNLFAPSAFLRKV